jgi:DNA topoisomerase-1
MVIKSGRFGKFIACSGYPECKTTKSLLAKIGVKCPECGGDIVQKRSKKKRIFYGCANYPKCNFATSTKPLPQPCPECGGLLVTWGKKAKCLKCEHITKVKAEREQEVVTV